MAFVDFIYNAANAFVNPRHQDFLLDDITSQQIEGVAQRLDVSYLSEASFPGSFPVQGVIHGPNNRLFVNLACKKRKGEKSVNIIFLIVTGSPYSYLSEEALRALEGNPRVGSSSQLHSKQVIFCYPCNPEKNFANVNILGMDFIAKNRLSLKMNFDENRFLLVE